MTSVDLTLNRLTTEEGYRAKPYRDTRGNLSVGYGCNLDAGISQSVAKLVLGAQLQEVFTQIIKYDWFKDLNDARASVLLDMAFNNGVAGLLKFKDMLAAISKKDWTEASKQLLDSDAARELPSRYAPLAKILLTGEP